MSGSFRFVAIQAYFGKIRKYGIFTRGWCGKFRKKFGVVNVCNLQRYSKVHETIDFYKVYEIKIYSFLWVALLLASFQIKPSFQIHLVANFAFSSLNDL